MVVMAALLTVLTAQPAAAAAAPTPPGQPTSGPGGSDYSHTGYRTSSGGTGSNAWYVFEPTGPTPSTAPLTVIAHGYGEFSGYASMLGLIQHTVRKGSIVIYPRWQTGLLTPCLGPANIEPCMSSTIAGIQGALAYLRADPTRVQPELDRTSYFGHSFGGIIVTNLANRHQSLGLPTPRVVLLDDPHDGGFAGAGEPALDDTLTGIPSDTLFQCHVGASGITAENGKADSSCNAIFPKLDHIPAANKDLVLTYDDAHGAPALSSAHGVSRGGGAGEPPDAYDWYVIWKIWDALRDPVLHGQYALGDTPEHRYTGTWSDGVPVIPLKIQDTAPIRP